MRGIPLAALLAAVLLVGCASTGVVPMDKDTFMIAKKSAGGLFVTGEEVKADLYKEAAEHCAKTGQKVETIKADGKNAIPFARTSQASLEFRCVNS